MNLIQAITLGIVEGITEFLPISSTGHLILASKIINIANTNFTKSFNVSIQLGAILCVVILYYKKLFNNREIISKVLVAFFPTAILGFIFYKIIKKFLLSSSVIVIASLFIGGILIIAFEIWYKKKFIQEKAIQEINYKQAFLIGIAQTLAMIPGVSRSAATIISGLMLGVNRKIIVEFSFLLAVPTMAAATFYDLFKSVKEFSSNEIYLLAVGFFSSFIVALIAVRWLTNFVKKHTFVIFGIYRILVASLFLLIPR